MASSALIKEKNPSMQKHVKERACLYSMYDIDIQGFAEADRLAVGEKLNGKVDLFLADLLCNKKIIWNDVFAEYDVFALEIINYLSKMLGYVIMPGAHVLVSCSAVELALWYNAFASEREKDVAVLQKILESRDLRKRKSNVWSRSRCLKQRPQRCSMIVLLGTINKQRPQNVGRICPCLRFQKHFR